MLSIFYFVIISLQLSAQELLPFVENYSKVNYQGDNQIWSLTQGKDNAMYFANNHYLLRYDGVKWEKNMLPNKTIIRSVMQVGERIYSGSYKEFGYWLRRGGAMKYVSITSSKSIFKEKENEEIWKIFKFNSKIYFQSFNALYIYDGVKIRKIKFPFLISYCFVVSNQLLVASVEKGVFKLMESKFVPVKGWDVLENSVIHSIQQFQNEIFVFTKKNGVFIEQNGVLKPWNSPLNETLKTAIINDAQFIKNNKLVIGTASKGAYIYNLNDDTFIDINRNNVLENNSVLTINQDKENNLWLGLDNGIAFVEVSSNISIFYDNSGTLGSVYSVATVNNGYIMASNHGVFKYVNNSFSLIPTTQGQAWNISKIGNRYLIGHNEGNFLYRQGNFSKLNSVNGGWNLTKSMINNTYLQATFSGIVLYPNANNLSESKVVQLVLKPIRQVSQNRKNELWAADNYKGLYRITLDDLYNTVKVENVTDQSKFVNDFGVKIFEFRNDILFLIDNSWYTYNSITNKLEKNALFNENFKDVSDVIAIDEGHFLVLKGGLLYAIYANKNKFIWNSIQEKYYRGKIINDYIKIFKTGKQYLLNLDDGFISFQLNFENSKHKNLKIEAFNNGKLVENNSDIKHNSELKIYISTGVFGISKPNLFYKIDQGKVFVPLEKGLLILNNLNSGSHDLSIYYHDGLNYKLASHFDFNVNKPWYFSFWMILLYVALIGFFSFLYYKWNKIKYLQNLALQEEELKHQNKIIAIELKAENELNSQEYEKHILELNLKTKASEVAGKSLSIAKQSEMIENIRRILDSETDFNKLKNEINKAIKINAVNKHEWETFETNLNQINNQFIVSLSKKYPNLTSKDIKLCIYLKMNLSSKEIAPMMNISFRGVELHRYRLRKKLSLIQDESLAKFLSNLE